MKRVFICGVFNFPRGGATSNYVQYLSMALQNIGYEAHVISMKNNEYGSEVYKDIIIDAISYRSGKFEHYYDHKTGLKAAIIHKLDELKVSSDDIVMIYSHNLWLHKALTQYCRARNVKVGSIVVEFFPSTFFKHGKLNFDYWLYYLMNKYAIPKEDFILPISTYIENKFSHSSAKQMVLPIMADPYEFDYKAKEIGTTRKFIFPANGKMKDAFEQMICAIDSVLADPDLDVEFHFCGVKEDAIKKVLNLDAEKALDKRITVHGWLEYKDLVMLFEEMHFLLLARETTELTKANFPSKVPELLCYGVIPIASKVGDYTEFYLKDGENSLVFEGCDVETIQEMIKSAINKSNEEIIELSTNARALACEAFYYKQWEAKIQAFLEDINED